MSWLGTIRAFYLTGRSGQLQKRGEIEKSIALGMKAIALSPKMVAAYCMLVPALINAKRFREAEDVVHRGLAHHPTDTTLNRMMVEAIIHGGGGHEKALPYLETYWKHRNPEGQIPQWVFLMAKVMNTLRGRKFDSAAAKTRLNAGIEDDNKKWDEWAKKSLEYYERPTD